MATGRTNAGAPAGHELVKVNTVTGSSGTGNKVLLKSGTWITGDAVTFAGWDVAPRQDLVYLLQGDRLKGAPIFSMLGDGPTDTVLAFPMTTARPQAGDSGVEAIDTASGSWTASAWGTTPILSWDAASLKVHVDQGTILWTDNLTISLKIQIPGSSGDMQLFNLWWDWVGSQSPSADSAEYELHSYSSNSRIRVAKSNSGEETYRYSTALYTALWDKKLHSVIYRQTGDSMAIYVDGTLTDTVSLAKRIGPGGHFGEEKCGDLYLETTAFNGALGDVKIWNRALTDVEIRALGHSILK